MLPDQGIRVLRLAVAGLTVVALAGCGSSSSEMAAFPCIIPTVMPTLVSGGPGAASALLEVDLGELATGRDPVVLTSVHLRADGGDGSTAEVRSVRLADSRDAVLWPAPADVDLRALAEHGHLGLVLELAAPPPGSSPLAAEICVTRITPRGML